MLAGALRMPFSTFFLFTFAGAACWALVIGYVGFLFGSSWGAVVNFVGRMDRIALGIMGACVVVFLLLYLLRRRRS